MQLGVLENDKLYLEYCPDVGGSIFKFQAKVKDNKIDIFRGFNKRKIGKYSSYFSGYFSTIPYFGAIRKQSLFYKNKYISLKRTHPLEPDTIHGEGWINNWEVVNGNKSNVSLKFFHDGKKSFPYKYETIQKFRLIKNCLEIKVSIKNKDRKSFDCGVGFHPWFNININSRIFSNTYKYVEIDKNNKIRIKKLLKNNQSFDFNKINIDETFISWNGNTKLILNKLLTVFIKNKKNVKNLHIYSPKNENFFCVEPVTNTRDSYFFKKNNMKYHGLKNLKPGKIFEAAVIFKIIV